MIELEEKQGKDGQLAPALNTTPLFQSLDVEQRGYLTVGQLRTALERSGLLPDDPRLRDIGRSLLPRKRGRSSDVRLSPSTFEAIVNQHILIKNALTEQLVIPDFQDLVDDLTAIYEELLPVSGGHVATYIPQLARVDPNQFAVSICTIDGQRFSLGDTRERFCLQSTCKPINYCLALEELGEEVVHRHVGREPSGRSFNELSVNNDRLPHNPLINAGAIMCASLIRRHLDMADRFDYVSNQWRALCGNRPVSFNNSVYLSERQTADRNFALAYFMRENGAFPDKTDLVDTLEFYFQCCSIEACTADLAVAAATLASGGVNPLTGQRIFQAENVQSCLSLMLSCGMYDFSGEFAFRVGLPAKSGVSGAMIVVVPNVMGMSIWSPRLDELGNSVRGVSFCEKLIEQYSFHVYDTLVGNTSKKNPRLSYQETRASRTVHLIWSASQGDLDSICRLEAEGLDLSTADYDGRTALHLAAAEGELRTVKHLVEKGLPLDPRDRWGHTPLDEARRENRPEIVAWLEARLTERDSHSNGSA